jgi:ribosomal protein S18 acetylase RimI-like enzyme
MDSADAREELQVRPATPNDATDIAKLLETLGYNAGRKDVESRLQRLITRSDGGVLVAETANKPFALASYQLIDLLERGQPQCRVTALVTHQEHRRRGAGTALIQAVESIARERGCFRLEVTTRPERADALDFYASLGFRERPLRLVKRLDDAR